MNLDAHKDNIAKELMMILKSSIDEEVAAQRRYSRGAELAINPQVKELFEELAKEEEKHAITLRYKLKELVKMMGKEELMAELDT